MRPAACSPTYGRRCPASSRAETARSASPDEPDTAAPSRACKREATRAAPSASDLLRFAAARLPDEQPPLGDCDQPIEQQRKGRQHDNAGKDGVDIERALGLQDEVPDPARRAEVFAD